MTRTNHPVRRRAVRAAALAACALLTTAAAVPSQPTQPTQPTQPATETLANSAADPGAEAWIEATLARLTLRERVAQLVMPWVRGGRLPPRSAEMQRLRRAVAEDGVGGLIVGRGAAGEYAAGIAAAQAMAGVPLLVVSDLETGPGMRLTGGTNFPPAMAFGAADSEALAREAGRITAREARAVGIHMTLGPVLDVNTSPRNPIINTRAFGDDARSVSRMAGAWIEGAREGGLLTAGKHFPGHGATELDSHIGLPIVDASPTRLAAVDLVPFRDAAERGMEGMLVGHLAVTGIDGLGAPPASLSRGVVGGLLRERMGFDGLVFTDALNMGGVTRAYDIAEASILAILAGADVLLQPPGERRVIDEIMAAVESGRIPRERIDESARRVLRAKAAAGLHLGGTRTGGTTVVGSAAHREIVREVATRSVAVARGDGAMVPLGAGSMRLLHVVYADAGSRWDARVFSETLRAAGHSVEVVRVDERTGTSAFAQLRDRAGAADAVIASALVAPREYTGSIAPRGGFGWWVEEVSAAGRPVIAVSFGSPYIVEAFPSVPAYVLAWSGGADSQRAAARVLAGLARAEGRVPVSLWGRPINEAADLPPR